MFNGELLQIDAGQMGNNGVAPTCPVTYQNPETVAISNIVGNTFQANFTNLHCSGAPVAVLGAFPSGIIPTDALAASHPSTDKYLRMFGDINGDGNIVYVEYYCDTSGGNLTRSVTPYDQTLKNPGVTILGNITANPNNTACFQYQLKPSGQGTSSVVDVTVTLTVNTQSLDPQTHVQQQETKALLNVAPRNVFDAWLLGTGTVTSRLQPVPTNVTALAGQ